MEAAERLVARALEREPIVRSPRAEGYRNRMVYDLSRLPLDHILALPAVARAADATVAFIRSRGGGAIGGIYREMTVRVVTSGDVQLKLIIQAPQEVVERVSEGDEAELMAAMSSCDAWERERDAMCDVLPREVAGLRSICFQVARGNARPRKETECYPLWGSEYGLRQAWPRGASYAVGAETFSQVNPGTAVVLVRRVGRWLDRALGVARTEASESAGSNESDEDAVLTGTETRGTAEPPGDHHVLVTGREVNLFGFGLLAVGRGTAASVSAQRRARRVRAMTLVTHWLCVHKDAVLNAASTVCDESRTAVRALLRPKGEPTAAGIGAMREAVTWDSLTTEPPRSHPPPSVAVATAGRGGIGAECCAALVSLRLNALIYVACCEVRAHAAPWPRCDRAARAQQAVRNHLLRRPLRATWRASCHRHRSSSPDPRDSTTSQAPRSGAARRSSSSLARHRCSWPSVRPEWARPHCAPRSWRLFHVAARA